jgi:hypothetical protein
MTYYVTGRVLVERHKPETDAEEGDLEVLETEAMSTAIFSDPKMDLEESVYSEDDVPKEPGVYAIVYAARMNFYQTFEGDWDASADVEWFKVHQLNDNEAKAVTTYEVGLSPEDPTPDF